MVIVRAEILFRLGVIQRLRAQNFAIFWPPPCVESFYSLGVNENRRFLTPPHLVHVVIEWPLTSNMVAGPIWSSIGVTIRLSSVSSSEFELPALSELTKEPGLMGEPEVMDLPPRIDLKSEKSLNDET